MRKVVHSTTFDNKAFVIAEYEDDRVFPFYDGAIVTDFTDGLVLPQGFHAQVVHDGIKGLRHMAVTKSGDLYVSTRDGLAAVKIVTLPAAGVLKHFAARERN